MFQLVGVRNSSLDLMITRSTFPPASGADAGGGHLSSTSYILSEIKSMNAMVHVQGIASSFETHP